MTIGLLNRPLELGNGRILKNRLAKAAMSENMAERDGSPTEGLVTLYRRWAEGGAGLLITGNVMVDGRFKEEARNVVVEDDSQMWLLRRWAEGIKKSGAIAMAQISHPGRQAFRTRERPVAPSEMEMKGLSLFFKKPRALEDAEIESIIDRFVTTAKILERAGFDGVQIHGAHGYLISQFLSPLSNVRDDRWGGDPERRMRFLLEIVRRVRASVAKDFIVGVKLNSADFMRGGFDEEESMGVVQELDRARIDLLEVSGGNYEAPAMMGTAKQSTVEREAYFLDYAEKVRTSTSMPLMVTGGFRTREAMEHAIEGGAVDLIGIARPLALEPDLPVRLMIGEADRAQKIDVRVGIRLLDSQLQSTWYQEQLHRMAKGMEPNPSLSRWCMVWVGLRSRLGAPA